MVQDTSSARSSRGDEGGNETFEPWVEEAQLACEAALATAWHAAALTDWRAAAELLARRFPDRWRRATATVEVRRDPTDPEAMAERVRDLLAIARRIDEEPCGGAEPVDLRRGSAVDGGVAPSRP